VTTDNLLPDPWTQFLVSVKANIPRMVSGSSCTVLSQVIKIILVCQWLWYYQS